MHCLIFVLAKILDVCKTTDVRSNTFGITDVVRETTIYDVHYKTLQQVLLFCNFINNTGKPVSNRWVTGPVKIYFISLQNLKDGRKWESAKLKSLVSQSIFSKK